MTEEDDDESPFLGDNGTKGYPQLRSVKEDDKDEEKESRSRSRGKL